MEVGVALQEDGILKDRLLRVLDAGQRRVGKLEIGKAPHRRD